MFGFERLRDVVAEHHSGALVEHLIDALEEFTGPDWDQEDDVTFVLIKRSASETSDTIPGGRVLTNFTVQSEPGNEKDAMDRLASVAESYLPAAQLNKFKTAVAETVMNAMEHGNLYRADLPVEIMALVAGEQLIVYVTDQGGTQSAYKLPEPDLDAKLAGLDTPRGWGLLLIKNMVDEMDLIDNDDGHTVELKFNLQGDK
jgi:anti-sigma regulatory factor (Ser/Thr protein kinase)